MAKQLAEAIAGSARPRMLRIQFAHPWVLKGSVAGSGSCRVARATIQAWERRRWVEKVSYGSSLTGNSGRCSVDLRVTSLGLVAAKSV